MRRRAITAARARARATETSTTTTTTTTTIYIYTHARTPAKTHRRLDARDSADDDDDDDDRGRRRPIASSSRGGDVTTANAREDLRRGILCIEYALLSHLVMILYHTKGKVLYSYVS